ncbi:hypothetical protein SNE40_001667 [Patella caerulea]|uniref:SWIM-type domain-containing protein n=1 Tax=Patella caerulea TaxID=87958 RepID=A0AAN8KNV8_PATCE
MRIKKSVTSLYTSLDNVVSNLLTFEETYYAIVNEMNFKNIMKPRVPKASDIPDLACIYYLCTEEAIVFLDIRSLKFSKRDESSLLRTVSGGSNVYTTGLKKCECSFFQHLFLPCSHLMAVHKKEGYPVVAPEDIPNRWLYKPLMQISRNSKYIDTLKNKPDSGYGVLGDSGHDVLGDSGHDVLSDSAHDILGDLELNVDSDIKFVDNYQGLLNSEENKYSPTNQKKASDTKTKLETSEKYNKQW